MLFNKDDDKAKEKKRSMLGLLFNPRFDRDIKPLGESMGMFVRMIAMVFAAHRLFPKDHPAMRDANLRLTLREVIATAYGNLSFTKEGMPQVLLFGAVIGTLAFSALFVVMLVLSIFSPSQAHAQVFNAPKPDTDWGLGIIDYLFNGKAITFGSMPSAKPDCSMMQALGNALSFYSTAILALAGIILIYHLAFMIAETAHTGKPMGRANQVWAPIRLVIAIGLLVPIAAGGGGGGGCTVTGYNTGQYLAMQVGRWGSGLASNVWEKITSGLNHGSVGCAGATANPSSPACVHAMPDVKRLVMKIAEAAACASIVQEYIRQSDPNTLFSYTVGDIGSVDFINSGETLLGVTGGTFWDFNKGVSKKICGVVTVPAIGENSTTVYKAVSDAYRGAIQSNRTAISAFGRKYGLYMVSNQETYPNPLDSATFEADKKAEFDTLIADVTKQMTKDSALALATADGLANTRLNDVYSAAGNAGWMMAGSWFAALSRFHSYRVDSMSNWMPSIKAPALLDDEEVAESRGKLFQKDSLYDAYTSSAIALKKYNESMGYGTDDNLTPVQLADSSFKAEPSATDWMALIRGGVMDGILTMVDKAGGALGLWNKEGKLSVSFGSSSNPLGELAAFGQNFIHMTQWCLTLMAAMVLGGLIPVVGPVLLKLVFVPVMLGSFFFSLGFVLAFLVPLYPFIRFFFGTLTWLMTLFEAVVSMPLFALAHVNPYGDGISGQQAQYGYSVLLQLLLRPVLMVFGLVAGLIIFSVVLIFLNEAFLIAAVGTGSWSGGMALLSKLIYSVLYVALVLMMAKECFSLIGLFPQVALSWLGKPKIQEEGFKSETFAAAAAYLGKQGGNAAFGALERGMKFVPEELNKRREDGKALEEKGIAAGTARSRHDDIVQGQADIAEGIRQHRNISGQQLEAAYEGNENTSQMVDQGDIAQDSRQTLVDQGEEARRAQAEAQRTRERMAESSESTAENTAEQIRQNTEAENTRGRIEQHTDGTKKNTDRIP